MINIGDILYGRLSMNASGSAYLVSAELPKDIYIHNSNTNHALHLDNVKIEVIPGVLEIESNKLLKDFFSTKR